MYIVYSKINNSVKKKHKLRLKSVNHIVYVYVIIRKYIYLNITDLNYLAGYYFKIKT